MKKVIQSAFLFSIFISYSQIKEDTNKISLNEGEYKSVLTSFKSEKDSIQNFIENTKFNIIIKKNIISIQDIRIPNKVLKYKCNNTIKKIKNLYVIEKCINQHLKDTSTSDIIFYTSNKGLNLMVSNIESSQVFFNLKLESKYEN